MKYSQGTDTKAIAVCLAKYNGIEQVEFMEAFKKACDKRNYRIFVFSASVDFISDPVYPAEEQIYELMDPKCYDAVVIMSETFKVEGMAASIAKRVVKSGTLCFSFNEVLEGCVTIRFGFENAFEMVVRHMIEHHKVKNVNFIAGNKGNPFSENRLSVFRKVCAENGIEVEEDRIGYGDFWEIPTSKVMDTFLSSGKKIDAIICANDFMAMEACKKLREAGINVPEDILVSGFDGTELEKYHYPRLATAFYDVDDAAEKIAEVIENSSTGIETEKTYDISCKFREGQSCGCIDPNLIVDGVKIAGVNSFKAHRHVRDLEANMGLMYEKVPKLGSAEKLFDIWGDLYYLKTRFFKADLTLLINDDFLKEDLELWPSLRPSDGTDIHNYYTEDMRIAMKIRNDSFTNGGEIKRADLLPDLSELLNKDVITIFFPVHVQKSTVGYGACSFDPNEGMDYFLLLAYVNNLCQILEVHKSRLDQQNLYSTDQLTKLLNRKGFYRHMEEQMEAAVLSKKPVCVISIDMNGLKHINDTYGHKEGDFSLAKIGESLEGVVGEMGVCTRFGGDEFAIAFSGEEAEAKGNMVMSEISKRLSAFNELDKKPYLLSVSMGLACHVPENVNDLERFLMEADKKMYKNKIEYKAHEAEAVK